MRVALVANTSWYLYNFRRNLMNTLRENGHQVIAISPIDEYSERLNEGGAEHVPWKLSGSGINPFFELGAVWQLRKNLSRHSVDLVLCYTPKGNVYSGFACLGSKRRTLANISGLGRVFSGSGWMPSLLKALYRLSFVPAAKVFFQNEDDLRLFILSGLISGSKTERLMGSGVDLTRFGPSRLPCLNLENNDQIVFLLVARLIWEKGVAQFVDAARSLKQKYPGVRFQILGKDPEEGTGGVTYVDLESWSSEGVIEYLGVTDNVPDVLTRVDCVVLPSYYREGVPRSLIEAAAMGRPCITTNTPGCRDVVKEGENGWLCVPRDAHDLAEKISMFINAAPEKKHQMSLASHRIAVEQFDEQVIIQKYLKEINDIGRDSR